MLKSRSALSIILPEHPVYVMWFISTEPLVLLEPYGLNTASNLTIHSLAADVFNSIVTLAINKQTIGRLLQRVRRIKEYKPYINNSDKVFNSLNPRINRQSTTNKK